MVLTKTPICNFEEKAHDFNLKGVDNKFYKLKNCVGSKSYLKLAEEFLKKNQIK